MKKQLLIAAVAATMSASALADISITGAASATWTHTDFDAAATANTNVYAQDLDITITGTSGDTTVSGSIDLGATTDADVGDITMTTTLMGMDITVTDDGGVVEFIAGTTIAGLDLTFEDSNTSSNGTLTGSLTVAGATVKVAKAESSTKTTVSGDMGGVTGKYVNFSSASANANYSTVEVSGSALGSTLTVTAHSGESATAAFLDLDGTTGSESSDGNIIALTTDLGGNSVTVTKTDANLNGTATVSKTVVAGTRALASGADLTATYTNDTQDAKSSVALKIAVSF